MNEFPEYRIPRWPWTLNSDHWQAQALVGWFPFMAKRAQDWITGERLQLTGGSTWVSSAAEGPTLDATGSGSLRGATISPIPASWQLTGPLTLFWRGYVWNNGTITNNPLLVGVNHNNAGTSPFTSYALARPNAGGQDHVIMYWNDAGTFESYSLDVNLSGLYKIFLDIVGVFDSTVRIYINGRERGNSASGLAGTIQYDSTAEFFINRHRSVTNNTCQAATLDTRIYNRVLSANEIAALYHEDRWSLYYELGRRSYLLPGVTGVANARSQVIICG